MTISATKIQQLLERMQSGQILKSDFDAFLENPRLWRDEAAQAPLLSTMRAQQFWQSVYDEIGIRVTVPAVPKLTERQVKSLDRFGFLLVYIPAITEEEYPKGFVKPVWGERRDFKLSKGEYGDTDVSKIERKPLKGRWVGVEMIAKLPRNNHRGGNQNDPLMVAVKRMSRCVTYNDLTHGLLVEIAKVTGFPKKGTRLLTGEEWNIIANLFNWLRDNRSMNLPDLGSTNSWEWCENACEFGHRLLVGSSVYGGLAAVDASSHFTAGVDIVFRVLVVL